MKKLLIGQSHTKQRTNPKPTAFMRPATRLPSRNLAEASRGRPEQCLGEFAKVKPLVGRPLQGAVVMVEAVNVKLDRCHIGPVDSTLHAGRRAVTILVETPCSLEGRKRSRPSRAGFSVLSLTSALPIDFADSTFAHRT